MRNIKPKLNFVLIEVVKKEDTDGLVKTKSGIIIPGKEKTKTTAGFSHSTHKFVVREVGSEVKDLKAGDLVIFSDTYANAITDDDDRLWLLLKEDYVYASYED